MKELLPGRGHNRPPPEPRRHGQTLESPAVQSLLAEFVHLRQAAISECNGHLRRYTNGLGIWRFSPSKLRKWPTGRTMLVRHFLAHWTQAIGTRAGQLRHLDRKLTRSCAAWRPLTDAELTAPPAYAGDTSSAYETIYFPQQGGSHGLEL